MTSPPYALLPLGFPFPALAALAARAPLGGAREVAVATLQIARVVRDAGSAALDDALRTQRAAATRSWLAAFALPPEVRAPLGAIVDASAEGERQAVEALRRALPTLARWLDDAALAELGRLVSSVAGEVADGVTPGRSAASGETIMRRPAPERVTTG